MNILALAMKDQNPKLLNNNITIERLSSKFATELKKHDFFKDNNVLNHGFKYRILQGIKLIPQRTRFVVYHKKDKVAIGFLCLEKNSDWLYSIKYIYVSIFYK